MNDNKPKEKSQTVLFSVYVLWCRVTGKFYVGVTHRKVETRISEHKRGKLFIDTEIQRLGWEENFDWWVVESHVPANLISEREQYWVGFLDCVHPKGYNKTCGGISNITMSEDSCEKIRQKALARNMSGENNPFYGKRHTEDTLAKMRSKRFSNETRARMSESHMGEKNPMYGKPGTRKGKHHTTEAKEKNRQAHLGKIPWNKGIPCSKSTKAKICKANRGRKGPMTGKHHSEETKKLLREKVLARHAAKRATKAVAEENLAAANSTPTSLSTLNDAVILQKGLRSKIAVA